MKRDDNHPLSARYAALFGLLKETEPIAGKHDVEWWGPYFIPRARQWYRRSAVRISLKWGLSSINSRWRICET